MNKALFFIIAASVLAVAQSAPQEARLKFNLGQFLNNPNLQNQINQGLSQLKDPQVQSQINQGLDQLINQLDVANNVNIETPLPTQAADTLVSNLNVSEADLEFVTGLIQVNLQYFVNTTSLSQLEKNAILSAIPRILAAQTIQDIVDAVEPLIFSGFIVFFEDPYIIFSSNPYLEASKRFLQMFFVSPQAPDFLQDPATQAQVIAYVDTIFASNNITITMDMLLTQVNTYLSAAVIQDVKPYIQQYLPDLFPLVQYETDFTTIATIFYQYAVTNSVQLYTAVLGLIMPMITSAQSSEQIQQALRVIDAVRTVARF